MIMGRVVDARELVHAYWIVDGPSTDELIETLAGVGTDTGDRITLHLKKSEDGTPVAIDGWLRGMSSTGQTRLDGKVWEIEVTIDRRRYKGCYDVETGTGTLHEVEPKFCL